jgi:hypothetical protein
MTDSQKERRGDLQHEVRHHRPTYEGLGNRFQVCVHTALSKKPYSLSLLFRHANDPAGSAARRFESLKSTIS